MELTDVSGPGGGSVSCALCHGMGERPRTGAVCLGCDGSGVETRGPVDALRLARHQERERAANLV